MVWLADDAAAAQLSEDRDVILGGDVGGTKTILALCDDAGVLVRERDVRRERLRLARGRGRELRRRRARHRGVLRRRRPGRARRREDHEPAVDDPHATRSPRRSAARASALINDLQATALGALVIPAELVRRAASRRDRAERGTISVIAPGTGLGEATLFTTARRYRALPSEGGHADFAPTTDEEVELWRYLHGKYGDHVSNERILSGNGIADLYGFASRR